MIRRDATFSDGSPAWMLISQIEHARVAGELAAAWGGPQVESLPFPEVLVPAVYRHDDGWRAWEGQPDIEPTHSRPYNFLEIPAATAHRLWSASIADASDLGPLAQAIIAGHFVELRRHHPGGDPAAAAHFIATYETRIRDWREEWIAQAPGHTLAAADCARQALQFFDYWSLWFCCSAKTGADRISTDPSFSLRLWADPDGTITVSPWPFRQTQLTISAVGRCVRAQRYLSTADLASAPDSRATIS